MTHYLVDGYNLLFRMTKDYRHLKQNERKLLLALNKAITERKYHATFIFDGREKDPPMALRKNLDSLTLIYTPHHQTADDYILEMVADGSEEMTVVSSDLELLRKAKQRGAHGITVEKFLSQLAKKKKIAPLQEAKESSFHFQRLLKIFVEKLEND